MWDKGVSDHFQNLYGMHQHLVKTVSIISPSCSFKLGDLVFPGCLFCSVPCKFCGKPLQRITVFCQQIASLLNSIRSLLIRNCCVLSLWWFKAQRCGCESRTPSGKGDRHTQFLYTGITREKGEKKPLRLNEVIQSLFSAEQLLEQNEMRRDCVVFVGRSKPKTWQLENTT